MKMNKSAQYADDAREALAIINRGGASGQEGTDLLMCVGALYMGSFGESIPDVRGNEKLAGKLGELMCHCIIDGKPYEPE